jgi:hypothetical protein
MPNQSRLRFATVVPTLAAAACLLLAACSSNPTPLAGSSPPVPQTNVVTSPQASAQSTADPCSLLTQSEVDAAAGQALGHGNRIGALDDCQWSTSDFAGSVELDVADWSAIKVKSAQAGRPLTSIAGVGDEALSFNQAGNAAELYVRKGTSGFLLLLGGGQYIGTLPALGLAQEKVLAASVLGRL